MVVRNWKKPLVKNSEEDDEAVLFLDYFSTVMAKRGKANSTSFRAKKILAQSCEEHLLGLAAPACHVELHLVYVKPLEVQKREQSMLSHFINNKI